MKALGPAVLALLLAACSEKDAPPVPGVPAAAPAPAAAAPAAPTAPSPPLKPMPERDPDAPWLSLSINGSIRPVITRGRPAYATAEAHPPGTKIAVEGWSETPGGWSLTPEQTSALPAGRHRVTATAGALRVEVEAVVRDEPASPSEADLAQKRRDRALALRSASKWDELLAFAKESGEPEWEGDALAGLGKKEEAARAYGEALTRWRKANPKAKELPTLLLRKLHAARGS
jgi:hypothetical protein